MEPKTEKNDCILCCLPLTKKDSEISKEYMNCSHIFHKECLQKHFKPECPLCRKTVRLKVKGTRPICNIEYAPYSRVRLQNETPDYLLEYEINSDNELVEPSDYEYDSENPHGDEWDYEDV